MKHSKFRIFFVIVTLLCSISLNIFVSAVAPGYTYTYDINLCGIVDPDGADRTGWQTKAASILGNIPDSVINKHTAFTSAQLASYIKASEMFIIHSHGNSTAVKTIDSTGSSEFLRLSTIESWSANSLSNLELAFLGFCSSGKGRGSQDNFISTIHEKGADCVIGYSDTVRTKANYIMIESFSIAIGAGYTVSEALAYADSQVLALYGSSGNTNQRYILGDVSQRFTNYLTPINSAGSNLMYASLPTSSKISFSSAYSTNTLGFFDRNKLTVAETANNPSDFSISEEYALMQLQSICSNSNRYALTDFYYTEETDITTYIYSYRINGINTNDYVFLMFNSLGDLVSYGKPCEGAFDDVNISESELNTANTNLIKLLAQNHITNFQICDKRIVWDDDSLAIRYSVSYSTNSSDCIEDFIITL